MIKVVWLPNETDYSYCEFVVPNTPYLGVRDTGNTYKVYFDFVFA